MPQAIEYQKIMSEIVYINLPGPEESTPTMTGGELRHGFLAELYRTQRPELKAPVGTLCRKWHIHYRLQTG